MSLRPLHPNLLASILLLLVACVFADEKKTLIKVANYYAPNSTESVYTRQLIKLMKEDPTIELQQWGGIRLPSSEKSSLMMAIAGKTAPDIGQTWFHIIRNEIKQEFLYPLNEWIGDDLNGNGQIDLEEAKWDGWKEIPPLVRRVATVDGKVYGLPIPVKEHCAIIFRTDLVETAGLDPNKPPKTWDEFMQWAYVLTDANLVGSNGHPVGTFELAIAP